MAELLYARYTIHTYHSHTDPGLKEQGYWEYTAVVAHAVTDSEGVCLLLAATEDEARKLIATLEHNPEKVAALKVDARRRTSEVQKSSRAYGHRH